MKHFSYLIILLIFSNCKFTEKPEFVEMKNFDVSNQGLTSLSVSADAIFFNPNDIGYELVDTDIEVFINGQTVGKAKQPKSIEILANTNFEVPLTVNFSLTDLGLNSRNILKSLTNSIIDQKFQIDFKGNVTLKKSGVPFTIPMVYSQEIGL